jgi:hypothetical protein
VLSMLRDADPAVGSGRAIDLLRQARAKVEGLRSAGPAVRVELLNALGWSLLEYQDSASADAVVQEAVAEAQRSLPAEHPQRLRARVLLAISDRYRGRNREMRAELDALLPLLRRHAHDAPQDLIRALRNRANLALHEGDYRLAIDEAEEAARTAERWYGPRHPESATSALVLALARIDGGADAAAALAAARHALELALAARDGNARHPTVIEARALLGRALRGSGDVRGAAAELEQAFRDTVDVFGPDGMGVGFYSEALAEVALDRGRIDEALALSERAVRVVSAHAAAGSYVLGVAQRVRGEVLLAAGQPRAAVASLEPAARAYAAALGAAHARTRAVTATLGLALARAGDLEQAAALLGPLVRLGVDGAAHALGTVERLRGNATEALRLQSEALARVTGPRAAWARLPLLRERGRAEQDLGERTAAARTLAEADALAARLYDTP